MEILIDIDNYEEWACNDSCDFSDKEKENIKKQVGFDNITDIELVNIGPGADFFVILLVVSIGLIKLGAEINDGLDGWAGIGKKIRRLLRCKKVVSVDKDGAAALAIELIARKESITRLVKIQETTINLADLSGMIPDNKGLSKRPHNYYIQTYCVNDDDIYVIGIKSTGETNIIKHFRYNLHGIEEIK